MSGSLVGGFEEGVSPKPPRCSRAPSCAWSDGAALESARNLCDIDAAFQFKKFMGTGLCGLRYASGNRLAAQP